MNLHKYLTKKHKNINTNFNNVLRKLVDIDSNKYQKNQDIILDVIKRQDICDYQSQLLSDAFTNFKIDIDKLTFTIKCSTSCIKKLTNKHSGLLNVKGHGLKKIVTVKPTSIGPINKTLIRSETKRGPYYTSVYIISVDGVEEPIRVYISEGTAQYSTAGIRLDFNPKHYTQREICAVFTHVESIIGARSYTSLLNKARITRLDIGFIVFGLSYLFVYGFVTDKRFKGSECFTKSDNGVVETTWLGKGSKIRKYDKTLEILRHNEQAKKLFGQLAMSTRFEYEYRPKSRLKLRDLENSSTLFNNIQVIDPKFLPLLSKSRLKRLIQNRTNSKVKNVVKKLNEIIGKEVPTVSLDKDCLESEITRVLGNYKKFILEPRKNFERLNK
jgi:hypothetical protein